MAIKPSQQVGCGTGVSLLLGDSAVTERPQFATFSNLCHTIPRSYGRPHCLGHREPMNWRSTFCCSFLAFVHQGSGPLIKGSRTASHGRGPGLAIPHELVVLEKDRNCSVMDQVLLQAWVWAARPKEESSPFMKPLDGHASCYHWFELQLLGCSASTKTVPGMANITATAGERTALAAVEPPTYPLDLMRRTIGFSLRVSLLYGFGEPDRHSWCTVSGPSGHIFLLTHSTHHNKQRRVAKAASRDSCKLSGGKTQPQGRYMRPGPKCWDDSSSL
nr:hypothetical protein B24P11.90 [imported] - Neurospora crassa [Neurospora crassa]